MSNYFILDRERPDEQVGYMEIEDGADGVYEKFRLWRVGAPAQLPPPGPVVIEAVPHEGYTGHPVELNDGSIPLMSKRIREALDAAGVDNIVYFPVTLRNPETGQTYEYFAFNLIGLVAAADLGQSNIASTDGDFTGDSQVYDLALDESKCGGFAMFRLKEKFSAIVVHRRVKETIESRGITALTFMKPEDYMHL